MNTTISPGRTLSTMQVQIPPGPLGISIKRNQFNGECVVVSKINSTSPLEVGDVLHTMNGIELAKCGPQAWNQLFKTFENGVRSLVVSRHSNSTRSASGADTSFCNVTSSSAQQSKKKNQKPVLGASKQAKRKSNHAVENAKTKKFKLSSSIFNQQNNKQKPKTTTKSTKSTKKTKAKASTEQIITFPSNIPSSSDPSPGHLTNNLQYYITKNNDTPQTIAAKIGLDSPDKDWKQLVSLPFNIHYYGKLTGNTRFNPLFKVEIPTKMCSKWMMQQLLDVEQESLKVMATCRKCEKMEKEEEEMTNPMLICDGCDSTMHLNCAGLNEVPKGDWLCNCCLDILKARSEALENLKRVDHTNNPLYDNETKNRSLRALVPSLCVCDNAFATMGNEAEEMFQKLMKGRKEQAFVQMKENQAALLNNLKANIVRWEEELPGHMQRYDTAQKVYNSALSFAKKRHDIHSWETYSYNNNNQLFRIKYKKRNDRGHWSIYTISHHYSGWGRFDRDVWEHYSQKVQNVIDDCSDEARERDRCKEKVERVSMDIQEAQNEINASPKSFSDEEKQLRLYFATLLGEWYNADIETLRQYGARKDRRAIYLGTVKIVDEVDIQTLYMLKEPNELVIPIPTRVGFVHDLDTFETGGLHDGNYYLYGTADLFSAERNDVLPMDFSHASSLRGAQRRLIKMLLRDECNASIQIVKPHIPNSVVVRNDEVEHLQLNGGSKYFDLSELVRDCNYPIQNQPQAPTPKLLADNGLVLRDYQKASLHWLLEKENNPTEMGVAGELFSRMRGGHKGDFEYYYCKVTGSILKNIFDFHSDVDQKDAAKHCGSLPSCAILGEEMGLGKTVIALSLIVASPPPIENRILPREYIAEMRHPSYVPPPSAADCTSSLSKKAFLSNATLVIVPMTLCSQWKSEVERFAPWMSIATLHNSEEHGVEQIASKDIIIASTFLLSQSGKNKAKDIMVSYHFSIFNIFYFVMYHALYFMG